MQSSTEEKPDKPSAVDTAAVAADTAAAPKEKPAAKPQAVYYTVKKGDNLSKVADRYSTTPQKIRKLNGLKNDVIRIGQRLRVK